ncbi:MAG: mannose-6-phosphate isomerase, class I [Vicinamibacteria bacterium]
MTLIPLDPGVQHYPWGDSFFIPSLLGRDNPGARPYAELWMGAHPDLPSGAGPKNLRELIERNPEGVLGPEVAQAFGGELPFLIKVLSAARPLSVQAHPSEEQARAGFLREEEALIPRDAQNRSYRDPRGKPELLAALSDFYAFVGFRPLEEIAAILEEVPELRRLGRSFRPSREALRDLYRNITELPQNEVDAILAPILVRLKRKSFDRDRREYWLVRCDEIFSLAARHDRGLLSALFLNLVHLKPGEAVFLGPGVLHSYLEGAGIEIMSSSNNVLRGGLTDKHVDLKELSRTVVFQGGRAEVLRAVESSETERVYPTRVREFQLSRIEVSSERAHRSEEAYSAEILLALEAEDDLELQSEGKSVTLRRGQSVLVTHGSSYRISGRGTILRASVPDRAPRFRGARPQELRFGTSGLRGLVSEMTDLEVYVNTRGFLQYLLGRREVYRGDPVSVAGDLRPSTDRILRSVTRSVVDAGFRVEHLGRIPTPALAWAGISQRRASIMVTGSHIPFDRNGVKFNRPTGEVLKADEAGILEAVARARAREYGRDRGDSPFDDEGVVLPERDRAEVEASTSGRESYVHRYLDFFPEDGLAGKRIVVYQHSAVGRDLLVEILRGLGAEVLPMGRADSFVPIDTEDISDARLSELERLASVAEDTLGGIDAIVSTDGDSDRPLVVGLTPEKKVRFLPGDLLGILVSEFLRADAVAVPVSATDAVDLWFSERGIPVKKTRIGSPYVIEAMEELLGSGRFRRIVGFEANGGFLTGSDLEREGRWLAALPTRDAVLPIVAVLQAAAERSSPLVDLFSRLPARYSKSGLIDRFPVVVSRSILRRFGSARGKHELSSYFTPELGFGALSRVDDMDGIRMYFDNGDIAHVRPSGNAPQLRIYAVAGKPERAEEMVKLALAEPNGILRRLQRAVTGD